MNFIFSLIMVLSGGIILIKQPESMLLIFSTSSQKAIDLSLRLLAIYAIWMGILQICEDSGLSKVLAKALNPLIKLLFGNISDEARNYISLNMSANILGMGNAATPAAINAINCLYEDQKKAGKNHHIATLPMIMLVVLNATSLQLLPTSIISLRTSFGSTSPSDIIIPTLIASGISTIVGIILVKILYKPNKT